MSDQNIRTDQRIIGTGFAWFAKQRIKPSWVINVAQYGAFLFEGSEAEAESMRAHKSQWEGSIGHKRPASFTDFPTPSNCWNHRGYVRIARYGSRNRLLKRPYTPRFYCDCGRCGT